MNNYNRKTALVTGAAGFIGYHISKRLLDEGWHVVGVDCLSDYYDISLKRRRESMLLQSSLYRSVHEKIEKPNGLISLFEDERPDVVIHLAAQAGVRYSIENPRAYLESNINGTFEVLEAARAFPPEHMLLASTSSAYGANKAMPYKETVKADHQLSFYAATKKSTESMAHSYAYLYNIPISAFRFFTVYGPWGRPDMAPILFTQKILSGLPIELFNFGEMSRDFTYIDDLVECLFRLIPLSPITVGKDIITNDSISPVAPYRVINIGNATPVPLNEFVLTLENALGVNAKKILKPMPQADVQVTHACNDLLQALTDYNPNTELARGIENMIKWYSDFYGRKD